MQITKQCPVCKKTFETNNGVKSSTTCSRSCSNTFFRDRRHTLSSNKKCSETLKGRKYTDRPRQKNRRISKNCSICNLVFEVTPSTLKRKITCGQKACVSMNLSNKLKGRTGGPRTGGGWGKQTEYAGVIWDSTWEARLAQRLDELKIRWVRPGKSLCIPYLTVDKKQRNYYPDVYLPDADVFIEVKGHWTPESRHRVQQGQLQKQIIVLESIKEIDNFTWVSFSG